MPDPIEPRRVYTADTAAPPLGMTAECVRDLCKAGELRGSDVRKNPRPGGKARWRIVGSELLAFLERRAVAR